MGNKVTTLYDFTLPANGSQQIQADANFYKILTASGDVSVTRDGGSTVKPMRAGRGERNVQFLSLTIKDLSGAPNSGTILVGDSDFIDDTIVLSSAINLRPEASSGNFVSATNLAVGSNTIFLPGANTNGVILQSVREHAYNAAGIVWGLLSKSGAAPATIVDGDGVGIPEYIGAGFTNLKIEKDLLIPAGHGLYVYALSVSTIRGAAYRWKAL